MRMATSASAAGIAALLIALLARPSAAQDYAREGAPIIRVYSQNGPGVVSSYVTPAIEVSENAYVFAVSMDLDGLIQVLHPDFPGISVRIRQHQQLRLPNFFAGFSHPGGRTLDASGQYASYPDYAGDENDTRGTVIALASRAPFNLERVESEGDWNISALRRLLEHRTLASAAQALASYLGAKGEPIGRDYMRFASARHNYYSSGALYSCDLYGGFASGLAFSRIAMLERVSRLQRAGQRVSILGYDFCGMPIVAFGPSRTFTGFRPQRPRDNPHDTSAAGKRQAALGHFPITRRADPRQLGDMTVTPPNERRRDPREIVIDRRSERRGGGLPPTTRTPLERTAPTRTETTVTGTQPIREYSRPVLREAPPPRSEPTRGPDRSSPPPAPVVHERPSSPPPPPPPVAHEQPSQPAPAPPHAQSEPRSTPRPVPPPRR